MDLDGQRVLEAGADHDRDDGHADQVRGAEPVEERLEQPGVARLVRRRRHHGQRRWHRSVHGTHGRRPTTSRRAGARGRRGRPSPSRRRPVRRRPPTRPRRLRPRPASSSGPWGCRRRSRPCSRRRQRSVGMICGSSAVVLIPGAAATTDGTAFTGRWAVRPGDVAAHSSGAPGSGCRRRAACRPRPARASRSRAGPRPARRRWSGTSWR